MAYARTGYGPGNIGALQSGAALSYGPTIGTNDPTSPQSVGGSRAAYSIPPAMAGCCGCGAVTGHAPVPMRGLGSLLGLGAEEGGGRKFFIYGSLLVASLFVFSYLKDKYSQPTPPRYF